MTQEFHISVTPIGEDQYLVRTERVAPGVPLAEEQVVWPVDEWLSRASQLMDDPLLGVLRGDALLSLSSALGQRHGKALSEFPNLHPETVTNLVSFGQDLYNALFRDTLRDSWMTAQGVAQHRGETLRLRLGLKGARLHRLPWEVLHAGDRPLATGTDVVFSRYHSNFTGVAAPQPLHSLGSNDFAPLRILMVLSAPTDQDALALKQEALHLQEELERHLSPSSSRQLEVQLTLLEQPGREQLTQALEHNHYHVLHYAGHSELGAAGGSLYLVSHKTGLTETLNGEDLAGLLVNNGIRMAVFNSCRGSYTATAAPSEVGTSNLAEALVKRGIPAVLAMAERIPDDVALNLSRLFYRSLKQAYPIDLSLSRARQGLLSSYGSDQLYWALPILYLHPDCDGYFQAPALAPRDRTYESQWDNPTTPLAVPPKAAFADAEDAFDPDDLEFEDPDYEPDYDTTVARLVNQLAHDDVTESEAELLPASPTEDLLPDAAHEYSRPFALEPTDTPIDPLPTALSLSQSGSAATLPPSRGDMAMYVELEHTLADTGKLTDAIAAGNREIQANPHNAQAYANLGKALYQQGYLAEAIVAYHQAIDLNPSQAGTYHYLGLALYQQGNLGEAIQAFDRAIQLDPNLTEAHRDLAIALRRQAHLQTMASLPTSTLAASTLRDAALPTATVDAQRRNNRSSTQPRWQRLGLGIIGSGILLLGGWAVLSWVNSPWRLLPSLPSPVVVQPTDDLRSLSSTTLTALATEHLSQGKLSSFDQAVTVLLDRGDMVAAGVVLNSARDNPQYVGHPTINYLMGRLAWQLRAQGNPDYSPDDIRRYWSQAAKAEPTLRHLNALGFAYYAEGNWQGAARTWLQASQLAESSRPDSGQTLSADALTAYAGLALALTKSAEQEPPQQRTELLNRAIQLRQTVISTDPVAFQPGELGKNWLWNDASVRDWRSLLAMK